ncbi:efflux RND transporter periplasmic adaptor subunit [Actinoplanes sp. GCM10030250]|uniref:efflux RND transporter periplasmic adaptor subunit n=1 Tax=Actinoplanes sp. GCM10030250 TaxID=3273376 RepID=UPI003606DDD6
MSKGTGQTRAKRRIRWIGAAIVIIGAIAGGVTLAIARDDGTTRIAVVVAAVDKGQVTVDVATTGTVEPASTRSLAFVAGGTLASVTVQAGNRVSAGQTLATVNNTEAAEDLSDARAKLAEAEDRLAAANATAVTATRKATACVRDTAATPGTDCATLGFPDTGADPVLDAEQEVNSAEKAVDDAEDALDGTVIKAPIAGTVVAVAGSVGDQVRAGSTVISLADTYRMQVRAEFPEADAGSLAVKQAATVTLAGSDAPIEASVVQVDPAGTSDGTLVRYGVLLSFTDSPDGLLVGQSAQVKVRTGTVPAAVRVPSTAIHDVSGDSGTVLVRSGNRSLERAVAVGLRGDQYTEITDGLAEGEHVVRSW